MKWMLALLVFKLVINIESRNVYLKSPRISFDSCLGSFVKSLYDYGLNPLGEENQYFVTMDWDFSAGSIVTLAFDSEAYIVLRRETKMVAELSKSPLENKFRIDCYNSTKHLDFVVMGPVNGTMPYFSSVMIDNVEFCHTPVVGILDEMLHDSRLARQVKSSLPVHDCGKRKIDYTELIVNGEVAKPGDWPWHVALYRHKDASNSYICGGTLISKFFVLTAAHCVTKSKVAVVPDILSVILGKYYLIGDAFSVEKKVFSVIVHEDFGSPQRMDNDIALLKLMTEAVYNDYIQPACIWSTDNNLDLTTSIYGTVVGWGISQIDDASLSTKLKQASLPIVSELSCIKSDPTFYGTMLSNERKFCAGWGNGTSPCNGDSGGGFMVRVPDTDAWFVRGIVSLTLSLGNVCDPTKFVIFTDVSKYEIWIRANMYIN